MPEAPTVISRQVSLSPALAKSVDDYRSAHRLASDSDAIRRLIELGLDLAKTAPPASEAGRRSVGPEDEARSGPEAVERPRTEMDD